MSGAATSTRAPWATRRRSVERAERPALSRLAPRLLGAVATGLLATAAFPPYDLWPLAVPAVAGLVLLCRGQSARRGALLGLAHGLALFLPLLVWMRVVGSDAWVALSLLEAAFYALMGALLVLVLRLPVWPVWVAALWVTQELARDGVPFGGFPWGRLAFAETASPLTPYAALGGAPLVTFATALTGALLAAAVVHRRRWTRALPALAGVGAVPLLALAVPLPTDGPTTTAAVVQGGVARPGLGFLGRREEVLRKHVTATYQLANAVADGRVARPDLVIWPENASDIDPLRDPSAGRLIGGAVQAVGVPVLVGAVLNGPGTTHLSNAGIVWSPQTGPGERYVKRHPVPFGEYIPFRSELGGITKRLDQIPKDFYAAARPGLLQVGPARVGDVICFEVAYDGLVRDVADGGAQVLVVQTNNATYNLTGQPDQQMAISRLRAVEYGRTVLVAATSGISAIIRPDGTVQARSRQLTPATLVARVPLRTGRTIAATTEPVIEWVLAGIGLLAALAGALAARAERRP